MINARVLLTQIFVSTINKKYEIKKKLSKHTLTTSVKVISNIRSLITTATSPLLSLYHLICHIHILLHRARYQSEH